MTTTFLKDVCHNVTRAQPLQSLSGESLTYRTACQDDGARLDVAADCFWGTLGQRVFFDVTVITPLSQMHWGLSLQGCYKEIEDVKKRKYDQRICEVEYGCFSPLILSISSSLGPVSTLVYKCITQLQSE